MIVYDGFLKVDKVSTDAGLREVVRTTDSICFLIYVKDKGKVLLVRQTREAMRRDDNEDGQITELAAGRFNVALGAKALAVKEAKEEVGATITEDDVVLLNNGVPMAVSAGVLTERSYLACIEITSDMIEDQDRVFGVDPGEEIERIWMTDDEFAEYTPECVRVFAMQQWFLRRINYNA